MTASESDFVVIGEILKPHGVRGEIRVVCHADSPVLFDEVPRVYLRPGSRTPVEKPAPPAKGRKGGRGRDRSRRPSGPRKAEIVSWREHKSFVLTTFKGVDDRDAAEALRGYEIVVKVEDLPESADGALFLREIEGLEIYLEDGSRLGEVADIMLPGGQEVWVIRTDGGDEVLFPVAEEFLVDVDPETRRVTIAPPPGLLDLYLEDTESSDGE